MLWGSGKGKREGKLMSLAGNAGCRMCADAQFSVVCSHLATLGAWSCIFSVVLRISQNNSVSKVMTMDYRPTFSFWQMFLLATTSMTLECTHPLIQCTPQL